MNKPKLIATYTYEQVFRCDSRGATVFRCYAEWSNWGKWSKNEK